MSARPPAPEVRGWIDRIDPSQRAVVEAIRQTVGDLAPALHELVYHEALGYSLSASSFDRIIYVATSRGHITLGFFFGASLDDPERLLAGRGKRMRHSKIVSVDDVHHLSLRDLIRQAITQGPDNIRELHDRRRN
ncbi:MAG: DUF1801 domain-containing protein [bacterium]|nr:DUF1801 domain-containing protein [bacterium]